MMRLNPCRTMRVFVGRILERNLHEVPLSVRGRKSIKNLNNSRGQLKSRGKGKPTNMNEVVSYGCGEKGHYKRDCPRKGKGNNDDLDSIKSAKDLCEALIFSASSPEVSCTVDTGASFLVSS